MRAGRPRPRDQGRIGGGAPSEAEGPGKDPYGAWGLLGWSGPGPTLGQGRGHRGTSLNPGDPPKGPRGPRGTPLNLIRIMLGPGPWATGPGPNWSLNTTVDLGFCVIIVGALRSHSLGLLRSLLGSGTTLKDPGDPWHPRNHPRLDGHRSFWSFFVILLKLLFFIVF